MFRSIITTVGVAAMALSMTAQPAQARDHHRYYSDSHGRYYYDSRHRRHYENCRAAGTVAGVIGGAVLGNVLTGHSGVGTVVGAGVGGVAGHQIAGNNCRH
jgi:hypothetical protein